MEAQQSLKQTRLVFVTLMPCCIGENGHRSLQIYSVQQHTLIAATKKVI